MEKYFLQMLSKTNLWKYIYKNDGIFIFVTDCCKPDLTTIKNVLHFVSTGSAKFMFNVGRELFFVPVIMVLKCLCDRSDAYIYEQLCVATNPEDHYYKGCLKNMLSEPQEEGLFSSDQIREYIGQSFRERVKYLGDWTFHYIHMYIKLDIEKNLLILSDIRCEKINPDLNSD